MSGNNFSLFSGVWGGRGKYSNIKRNSLMQTGTQVPAMHSTNESVNFKHREYICDISGSTSFTLQKTFSINPGLASTFPLLAAVASNFQEYRMRGLMFYFKSTSATAITNSTNSAMGSVMMVAQYRADAPAPTSKIQFLNEMWAVDTKPSDNTALPIECAPAQSPMEKLYLRSGSLTSTQDKKFYDLCDVFVATTGFPAVNVVGEIWCAYDVDLFKPVIATVSTPLASSYGHINASTGITTAAPLANPVVQPGSNLDTFSSTSTVATFNTEIGAVYLVVYAVYAATSATSPSISFAGTTNVPANFANDTTSLFTAGSGSTVAIAAYWITATANTITVTPSVTLVAGISADLLIFATTPSAT